MRRLCLGGSFDPIHWGHLRCAHAVAVNASFDAVYLVPAAVSPHKVFDPAAAAAEHRLAMCHLAAAEQTACQGDAAGGPAFRVLDLEIRRAPPSYTIGTVRALRSSGWDQVFWLIGGDQVQTLPKWHESEALLSEATLIVMSRPGHEIDWDALPPPYRKLRENVVPAPLIDISATEIRRRVRAGESIAGLVPESVERYIREQGLYR